MCLLDIDHIFDISTFRDPVGKYLFKNNKKDTIKMSMDILMCTLSAFNVELEKLLAQTGRDFDYIT